MSPLDNDVVRMDLPGVGHVLGQGITFDMGSRHARRPNLTPNPNPGDNPDPNPDPKRARNGPEKQLNSSNLLPSIYRGSILVIYSAENSRGA